MRVRSRAAAASSPRTATTMPPSSEEYDGRVHGLRTASRSPRPTAFAMTTFAPRAMPMNRLTMSAMSALFAPTAATAMDLVRAGEVADNGNVGGVEQLFQNGCCGDRQGKLRQLAPDRAVEHVEPLAFCGSHVEFLLSIQKHLDCGPSIAQSAPRRKHFSGFFQTLEDCTGTARRMGPFPCSLLRDYGRKSEECGRNQYTPGSGG